MNPWGPKWRFINIIIKIHTIAQCIISAYKKICTQIYKIIVSLWGILNNKFPKKKNSYFKIWTSYINNSVSKTVILTYVTAILSKFNLLEEDVLTSKIFICMLNVTPRTSHCNWWIVFDDSYFGRKVIPFNKEVQFFGLQIRGESGLLNFSHLPLNSYIYRIRQGKSIKNKQVCMNKLNKLKIFRTN